VSALDGFGWGAGEEISEFEQGIRDAHFVARLDCAVSVA